MLIINSLVAETVELFYFDCGKVYIAILQHNIFSRKAITDKQNQKNNSTKPEFHSGLMNSETPT